ncbi:YdeI/OmpD-associated family protein [Arundinibacter roseus]|uniref:Bacteriocin-protection protein n=1 Tax=Arundinibacter roseus TaxID=2070510 RepID=A0A4V2XAF4_9BACT|nr:YdeI/OmpD-associated family protein [Arundinibacter roseus]TDB67385.1 hypothetical protein EZE20_05400 [Arundinibacter roseus]
MAEKEVSTFCPANRQEWREWLQKNHSVEKSIWLIYYKKTSKTPSLTWSEAVDEALCFGWIDSLARPLDNERYQQLFSPRKPKSVWSKINKEKIKKLIETGLMTQAGLNVIEIAKQNGSWTILDEVEELVIPNDLTLALAQNTNAQNYFQNLSRSDKRNLLQWVTLAKRAETRQKRIDEIVDCTSRNEKPGILLWKKKSES